MAFFGAALGFRVRTFERPTQYNFIEMSKAGPTIIAFDGEFSGPFRPHKHYLVAIGFALRTPAGEWRTLRVCFRPPTPAHGFDAQCRAEFWSRPEMVAKLSEWEQVAVDPHAGMKMVVDWIDQQLNDFPGAVLVCDCPTDATWLDYYLATYADHDPLVTYTGKYTGWPIITDDVYRGLLRTHALYGVTERAAELAHVPLLRAATHDPVDDAKDIAHAFQRITEGLHFDQI